MSPDPFAGMYDPAPFVVPDQAILDACERAGIDPAEPVRVTIFFAGELRPQADPT